MSNRPSAMMRPMAIFGIFYSVTVSDIDILVQQELSYRKQIARQLHKH